jgi:hypothetical protein
LACAGFKFKRCLRIETGSTPLQNVLMPCRNMSVISHIYLYIGRLYAYAAASNAINTPASLERNNSGPVGEGSHVVSTNHHVLYRPISDVVAIVTKLTSNDKIRLV